MIVSVVVVVEKTVGVIVSVNVDVAISVKAEPIVEVTTVLNNAFDTTLVALV